MTTFEDRVALLCLDHYNSLPKTGKPTTGQQWTVLSCVVEYNSIEDSLKLVSLGTGSKCLGRTQMSCKGDKINDSHSEVLARRGFLRYVFDQIINKSEIFVYNSEKHIFCKKLNISYHFFSTQTPCGDASIFPKSEYLSTTVGIHFNEDKKRKNLDEPEICPKKQKVEHTVNNVINDIYRTGAKCLESSLITDSKGSGADFHVLGAIRTKPGRGDPTLSVSCSDKLSRWNIMGVQGALLLLILDEPIYFESIIITQDSPLCLKALQRAILGRWAEKQISLNQPYKINTPKITAASNTIKFVHARTSITEQPCPSGIVWVKAKDNPLEIIVNGSKQGVTKAKLKEGKGASLICRKRLYEMFFKVMELYPDICKEIFNSHQADLTKSYLTVKLMSSTYQNVWNVLRNNYFDLWTDKPMETKEFCLT
ncbi:tRNA-specific adenosine deaminase 1-like [Ctenocephalides felis]|uniref:tRNA-specific adenosine deaminase 1-like n=1 Tax=Ctenocephalides felis TaxID=7515 RepID=UPI000E6E2A15|nr:tRNA-specific adenosine deaminase 1-like [Ctenocephalides felis]